MKKALAVLGILICSFAGWALAQNASNLIQLDSDHYYDTNLNQTISYSQTTANLKGDWQYINEYRNDINEINQNDVIPLAQVQTAIQSVQAVQAQTASTTLGATTTSTTTTTGT